MAACMPCHSSMYALPRLFAYEFRGNLFWKRRACRKYSSDNASFRAICNFWYLEVNHELEFFVEHSRHTMNTLGPVNVIKSLL